MRKIGGITYAPASIALPIRIHLTVVPHLGIAKQKCTHSSRRRGHGEQEVTLRPIDRGCALRNTYACSASQREDRATAVSGSASETDARVAVEGDTVTVQYKCMNSKGEIIQTSDETEPLTFEVGAGEVMGNKMFQASGGEWNKDLLFSVPRQHQEMQRLEGRYANVGGLKKGLVVELANGSNAMVLEVTDASVRLDANNMMAGQALIFELTLVSIDPIKN